LITKELGVKFLNYEAGSELVQYGCLT